MFDCIRHYKSSLELENGLGQILTDIKALEQSVRYGLNSSLAKYIRLFKAAKDDFIISSGWSI